MMKENKIAERGHEFYMKFAIDLARKTKARGDAPVGSVVVQDGSIIAEGMEGGKTKKDITFHAEIEAIREANIITGKSDLSDCILYTTHEPCIMCSYVIRHPKINTVVFGVSVIETGGAHCVIQYSQTRKLKCGKAAPYCQRYYGERNQKFYS